MSKGSQIYRVLEERPELAEATSCAELYALLPNMNKSYIRDCKLAFRKRLDGTESELYEFVHNQKLVIPQADKPFDWQLELFKILEANDQTLILVPRAHGKSVLLAWYIEILMERRGEPVLLVGWTDQRKRIAMWVYSYFVTKKLIAHAHSEYKFTLKNGAEFFCYKITDPAFLGLHEVNLIIDDAIDDKARTEPHRERNLESRWESLISPICRRKTILSGTKKFKEDFYHYFDDVYRNLEGVKYAKYKRTPYRADGSLLCPERFTEQSLELARAQMGEWAWHSEMMQEPHEIDTGILELDDKNFSVHEGKSSYEYACISVDSALAINKRADYTAIVTTLKKKGGKLEYFVLRAMCDKIEFDSILDAIERAYDFIKNEFIDISVIVAIEKNAGGEYIIQSLKKRGYKAGNHIIAVHQSTNKIIRIESALAIPLKDKTLKFSDALRGHELINEIRTFPHSRKLDAIDSLAMGVIELEKKHAIYIFSLAKCLGLS